MASPINGRSGWSSAFGGGAMPSGGPVAGLGLTQGRNWGTWGGGGGADVPSGGGGVGQSWLMQQYNVPAALAVPWG